MISAVMQTNTLTVEVSGPPAEFASDVRRFCTLIPKQDRTLDRARGVWIIRNPENYRHVSFIRAALDDAKVQLTFKI